MKDVVEKILREEERANKILNDAKEESERLIKEAKKEKEAIVSQAILETDNFSAKQKEDSKKRFFSEKNAALEEAKKNIHAIREKKENEIAEISKKVFSRIIDIKE